MGNAEGIKHLFLGVARESIVTPRSSNHASSGSRSAALRTSRLSSMFGFCPSPSPRQVKFELPTRAAVAAGDVAT